MMYHRPRRACKPDAHHRPHPSLAIVLIAKRYGLALATAVTVAGLAGLPIEES
jgi:hypothetical protein